MKPVFEPSEFFGVVRCEYKAKLLSEIANAKIQKLRDEAPIIYKYQDKIISYWNTTDVLGRPDGPTHKARLLFIEPIKKECVKHEPTINSVLGIVDTMKPVCKHCDVPLEAVWKPKDET